MNLLSEPVKTDSVLGNFVVLQEEVPKRLRFVDHRFYLKSQKDTETGRVKQVNTLQFDVVEEDGAGVVKVYEVQAELHARQLAKYLPTRSYIGKHLEITMHGRGRLRTYTLREI